MTATLDSAKNVLRYLRRRARVFTGRDFHVPIAARVRRERLGSFYGGWWVVPGLIDASSTVYGVGVGSDVSWDLAMIERFGCTIHAFDPTPRCRRWLDTQRLPEKFVFHPYGLANYDGVATFVMMNADPTWDSYNPTGQATSTPEGAAEVVKLDVRRLETLMKELGHTRLDVLKMDIEGGEFDAIEDMLAGPIRPRQLLVEYHYWEKHETTVPRSSRSVDALLKAGYKLFARSPVGPELCFVRE